MSDIEKRSCEQCELACVRRDRRVPKSHRILCQRSVEYASLFDEQYGVRDEDVVPDSVIANPEVQPKKRNVPRTTNGHPVDKAVKDEIASVERVGLGDVVTSALKLVGVTDERVSKWIGKPCGCPERRKKLNKIKLWAKKVNSGKIAGTEELEEMLAK